MHFSIILLADFEEFFFILLNDSLLQRMIKAFLQILYSLSVVQSYFVYWAKIESSTVSQQTQNRTITENNDLSSTIKPALLQELIDLKGTFTIGKSKLSSDTRFFLVGKTISARFIFLNCF